MMVNGLAVSKPIYGLYFLAHMRSVPEAKNSKS